MTDIHDAVARVVVLDDDGRLLIAGRLHIAGVDLFAAVVDLPKRAFRRGGARSSGARRHAGRGVAGVFSIDDDPEVFTGKDAVRAVAEAHEGRKPILARIRRVDLKGERHGLPCDEHAVGDVVFPVGGRLCGRILGDLDGRGVVPLDHHHLIVEAREVGALCTAAAHFGAGFFGARRPAVFDRDIVGSRHRLSTFCGRLLGRDDDRVGARFIGIVGGIVHLVFAGFEYDSLIRPAVINSDL